ncbi:MAG: hypothetical protein IPF60_04125 [Betaproteobacteria bacterium]|nr:hypothetical protein [Betaproteobacteria bacterium]
MTDAPKNPAADPRQGYFGKQLADIDLEVARQAMLCDIPLDDRSLIWRVLENDATVCGKPNPQAFQKLRAALTMHLTVRDKAIASMGREEAMAMIDEILAGLRRRLGMPEKKAP